MDLFGHNFKQFLKLWDNQGNVNITGNFLEILVAFWSLILVIF